MMMMICRMLRPHTLPCAGFLRSVSSSRQSFAVSSSAIQQHHHQQQHWLMYRQQLRMLRCFHATCTLRFPIKRRRRPIAESRETQEKIQWGDEQTTLDSFRHSPVMNPEEFNAAAKALLEKLWTALKPLEYPVNENLVLTRGYEPDMGDYILVDLGFGTSGSSGQYTIQVQNDQQVLSFASPISGQVTYILSQKTNEWVGEDDGHRFEGLLVRDLIRQCKGVPNL
jgi:frataxin-like iron-binding protein CyaY